MSSVAKKVAKVARISKPKKQPQPKQQKQEQNDVEEKKPKKQSLKKTQKTAEIVAAKKLAKLNSKEAVSDKLNRAPAVKKQKAKHQFDPIRLNHGVVLIQNLPKGFFEKQLKKYFSQYGRVTRLRLARSERTGGSKGFAYIEFKYPEVAQVAAESMNGYLMFRQRIKTVYIPPDQQTHDYFKQPVKFVKVKGGKTKLITPKTVRVAKTVKKINKRVPAEAQAERAERSQYKLKFLEKKLAKAGINIDLSSQLYTSAAPESKDHKEVKKETKSKPEKKSTKTATAKVQKKRKVDSIVAPVQKQEEIAPKKKKSKKVAEAIEEPATPAPQKIRKNYVMAPTPESTPKQKKSKAKLENGNGPKIAVKSKKTTKKTTPLTDVKLKKVAATPKVAATSKVTKSKPTKSAAVKTKSLKKSLNKKK